MTRARVCTRPRAEWFFVAGLLLLAVALRFSGLTNGQPDERYSRSDAAVNRLPMETPVHPDEYFFVAIPFEMAVRRLTNPRFFESPSVFLHLNFFTYLLTDSGASIDHADREGRNNRQYAPFPAYVVARVYSALGGLVAVAAAYAAARQLGGRFAAAAAGMLTAASFTLIQHAHYATPSSLSAGFAAVCVAASFASTVGRRPRIWLFLLAGVMAGLAASTRYNAAGVSLMPFLVGLVLIYRARRNLGWVLAGWLLSPAAFVFGTPHVIFDWPKFWQDFTHIFNQFLVTGVHVAVYHLTTPWRGLFFQYRYLILFSLGLPAALAVLVGIYAAWRTRPPLRQFLRRNSPWLFTLILLAYLLVYSLIVLRTVRPAYNDHMLVPVIPQFALLAGLGAAWLYQRLGTAAPTPGLRRLLAPGLITALVIVTLVPAVQLLRLYAQPDTRYVMQRWVYAHLPAGSRIHLTGPYNVPLDPADYPWTQSYGEQYVTAEQVRAEGADYVIVSDAWRFDARRSFEIAPTAYLDALEAYYNGYDQAFTAIAHIDRPAWTGFDWMMQTAAYWHNPALTVYCTSRASCAAVR